MRTTRNADLTGIPSDTGPVDSMERAKEEGWSEVTGVECAVLACYLREGQRGSLVIKPCGLSVQIEGKDIFAATNMCENCNRTARKFYP
jgi:hypothetical protein